MIYVNKTMSIVAYGSGPLLELFIAKSRSKRGFTKVVVTRAGRLRQWSQGELRLYERLLKLTRLEGSPFYPRKISPKQRGLRTQIVVLSGRNLQLLVQCCIKNFVCSFLLANMIALYFIIDTKKK